jgi:alpha-mannosidase
VTQPDNSPSANSVPMIVCPTTHNDWDWLDTFEEYYESINDYGVKGILDSVIAIFEGGASENLAFCFSYTEMGYLRRYLEAHPLKAPVLKDAGSRFCVLGGGITSPDNQVNHCEVFIRNYLTGHRFLRDARLIDNVCLVAWLPDDFGHDPQLPVLIEALGMQAVALSRIPGSPQPTPCTSQQPADGDVRAAGLSFIWRGNDGSGVLTHFMPATYYGITNNPSNTLDLQNTGQCVGSFLASHGGDTWPGGVIFATQGGDWQFPDSPVLSSSNANAYNWAGAIGLTVNSGGVTARTKLGTFADYFAALQAAASDIPTETLFAENYWTGYFASRPQLKIDQYQAAQWLLGAEVLGAFLAAYGAGSTQQRTELAADIWEGWHALVPSSHHDFITGTSPDNIYVVPNPPEHQIWDSHGQLPMSTRAVTLASQALNRGLSQLAEVITATPQPNEVPVLVFNSIGCDLPDTAIVEMADPSHGATDYRIRVGGTLGPVQRSSEGTLLFQVPGMLSMAYQVVYLVPTGPGTPATPSVPVSGDYAFSNNTVNVTVSQGHSWGITHLEVGGIDYVQPNAVANQLGVWADDGNLYQFGMEFVNGSCSQGRFQHLSWLGSGAGSLVEAGPIRWRVLANLEFDDHVLKKTIAYTTQYDLVLGETQVRITTNGTAPGSNVLGSPGYSVLASFPMRNSEGATASMLEYGTSYFWENRDPQQSWSGLTFRASHDFAQLCTTVNGEEEAIAAVYHNGIPAWTIDDSALRGCILRNAPGTQRGGKGTDTDSHTQHYTLDVAAQPAVTGYPLKTSLYTQTKLYALAIGSPNGQMPEAAQLASVSQTNAVLRVAKNDGPSAANSALILRVQQSCETEQQLDINLPFSGGGLPGNPEIVTALETAPAQAPAVTVSGTTVSFTANRAVWTLKAPIGPGN